MRLNEDLARIGRARDALESEVARRPGLDALLLLAWAHLLWGDYRASDVDAKLASYERGRDVAKRAIEMAPRSPEAHLWYVANLGRWAVTKNNLQAAFLLSTLKQEIQTVLQQIRQRAGTGGRRVVLPRDPSLFGGRRPARRGYLRKALALDPHFTRARVELARCLIAQGRYDEARQELKTVLDERQPSYIADWVRKHRPTAERLMAEIRAK
jgi:tetratricopeptide (TPR) repeat protein